MTQIKTNQGWVHSVAYSPSGDRTASGGDKTICIWGGKTGELLIGPIKNVGNCQWVYSAVLDSSTLYSASDESARVFDSVSGTLLHRFQYLKPDRPQANQRRGCRTFIYLRVLRCCLVSRLISACHCTIIHLRYCVALSSKQNVLRGL